MVGRLKRSLRSTAAAVARRLYNFANAVVEQDIPQFANTPKNLHIEMPRRIFEPQCFYFGDDVHIGPGSLLVGQTYYPTEVMRHPGRDHRLQRFDPRIVIGNRVTATGGLTIAAMHAITIEDDVMLAGNVFISDGSHGFEHADEPYKYQPMTRIAAVTIRRGCWIGQNVVIMPGVTIGEMTIVGANSVVTRDVPPRSIVAGSPARVRKRWDTATQTWRPVRERAAVE